MLARELVAQAVAATAGDPDGNAWNEREIFRLLDCDGTCNRHLENPRNHPRDGYVRPREVPLTGDEIVNGEFLALTYCAHDPFVRLDDFPDREALEQYLISDRGILHPLIIYVIAFIGGRQAPYAIDFSSGEDVVVQFDKGRHPFPATLTVDEAFPARTVRWGIPMDLLGTIEPASDSVHGKSEWIQLIDRHPQLIRVSDREGVNPFTRGPMIFKANPDTVRVLLNGGEIGGIQWAMDDSRRLLVWSLPGAEVAMRNVAEDIATRLGWRLTPDQPSER